MFNYFLPDLNVNFKLLQIVYYRKIEVHPTTQTWTMGNLAANLLHNFRFDGIHYDRCIDTSVGAFPIRYSNLISQ